MKRLVMLFICLISFATGHTTPPPVNSVFKLSVKTLDPNLMLLEWKIKPGFFLYKDKIHLLTRPNEHFEIGKIQFPRAIKKTDPEHTMIKIYRHSLQLPVAILGTEPGESLMDVCFQGCSDDGFCYPPQTTTLKLTINDKRELVHATIEKKTISSIANLLGNDNNQLGQLFLTQHWIVIFASFFGLGLLLAFTPCVLPMIPVLSGIIVGQKNMSTHKAFFLSLSYVLSMAITYAIIGAIIAKIGSNLQVQLQSPWAIGGFSLIFILLALSMFGLYDLRLPSAWQTKLSSVSHSKAYGSYLGAAIMGCLSTLILSPCVTAPLIGALSYIAQTGDVSRGSLALFFLGLGMGTPLLIIGTSAGKWLPKAGAWMNIIKAFFGILLLMVAIQLLSRVLPASLIMGLWASILIFTGVYSDALSHPSTNQGKFRQGFGVISLAYGLLILIGVSLGNQNPLQPLVNTAVVPSTTTPSNPLITTVKTLTEIQDTLAMARVKHMPVLIDFYADWCATCQQIESTTLKKPEVVQALNRIIFVRVDVTQNNTDSQELFNFFHVVAPPTFIFYNENGTEQTNLRLVGDISSEKLLEELNKI